MLFLALAAGDGTTLQHLQLPEISDFMGRHRPVSRWRDRVDPKPDGFWFWPLQVSPEIFSLSPTSPGGQLKVFDICDPSLTLCPALIFSCRPSSTRSVMAGPGSSELQKHQLLHLFLLCRLFDLTFWAASDSISPGWNHSSGTYWPVTNQPISS